MHTSIRSWASFEAMFGLFLFAGVFKSHPLLSFLPIDMTILFFSFSVITAIWLIWSRQVPVRSVSIVLVGLFFLFVIWALLSLLWAEQSAYTIGKAIRLPTVTLWAITGAAVIVSSSQQRLQRFSMVLLILSVVVILEVGYRYATRTVWEIPPFYSSSYLLPSILLGAGLVSAVALFPQKQTRAWILSVAVLCTAHLIALLIPGARGPLLAAVGAVIVYSLLTIVATDHATQIQIPAWFGYTAIGSVVGVLVVSTTMGDSAYTLSRLRVLFNGGGKSATTRLRLYRHAIGVFNDNLLVGAGLGDFGSTIERSWAHNIVLEIASELGSIGLILFFSVVVFSLVNWLRVPSSPTKRYLFALLSYFSALSLVTGDINGNRFLFMSLGLLCFRSGYNIRYLVRKGLIHR